MALAVLIVVLAALIVVLAALIVGREWMIEDDENDEVGDDGPDDA